MGAGLVCVSHTPVLPLGVNLFSEMFSGVKALAGPQMKFNLWTKSGLSYRS